ncbi:MAG: hypothetical protein H6702_25675 [Myxococcales bacterium]|nr:hypothetical protein [Myxococcales bacterium]
MVRPRLLFLAAACLAGLGACDDDATAGGPDATASDAALGDRGPADDAGPATDAALPADATAPDLGPPPAGSTAGVACAVQGAGEQRLIYDHANPARAR